MPQKFQKNAVEPMPWAWGQCVHCKRTEPLTPQLNSHLGVSYGVSVKADGSQVPIRVVLMHGCHWHAWQWSKGALAKI